MLGAGGLMGDQRSAMLLLIAGPPGAGKTTLASAVGRQLGWTVLDKDTIKACLLRLETPEAIAGPASYELLLDIARDVLSMGQSIILDCPAHHQSFLDRCDELADETGAGFRILLCLLDREERIRRMTTRPVRPSQWTTLDQSRESEPEEWIAFFPDHAVVMWLDKPVATLTSRAAEALGLGPASEKGQATHLVDDYHGAIVSHVAAALIDDEGRILCVRQNYGARLWSLPGGGVEDGEPPGVAAIRETVEETGLRVSIDHLVGIYGTGIPARISLCFRVTLVETGEWLANDEICDRAWFTRDALPAPLSPRMRCRIVDTFDGQRGVVRLA